MKATKFGASLKDVLWTAQSGRCWICTAMMVKRGSNDPNSCSIDHIWPKSRYGDIGDIGVTLLACRGCNASRGSPQPTDAEIRTLIATWRGVDRRWLRWNLKMIEADVEALRIKVSRADLLRALAAA